MKIKLATARKSLLSLLLDGATITQAAEQIGVSERTIYRWLEDETFRCELALAEKQALDAVGVRLVGLASAALDALILVLDEPEVRGANVRRLAARDLLDLVLKWHELRTLEQRLTALEKEVFNR
jgi:hypothetical protein